MNAVSLPPSFNFKDLLLHPGSSWLRPQKKTVNSDTNKQEKGGGGGGLIYCNMLQEHILCVVNPSALDKNAKHLIIMKYINNDNYSS